MSEEQKESQSEDLNLILKELRDYFSEWALQLTAAFALDLYESEIRH